MFLTWFLGGYAICTTLLLAKEIRKKVKLKNECDRRCQELEKTLEDSQSVLNGLHDRVLATLNNGYKNLGIFIEVGMVNVIGDCPETGFMFIIKRFPFDPEDEEDYEFAKREAEELIEIIQKF